MNPSLDELAIEFSRWRSQKRYARERIPTALLDAAVSLLSHHPQGEILRRLRLDRKILLRHQRQSSDLSPVPSSPHWVELSPTPALGGEGAADLRCQAFEVLRADGHCLRVSASCERGFAVDTLLNTFLKESHVTSDGPASHLSGH